MAGELTPEALRAWEMACMQFFLHKEVKDIEMVKKVILGMQELDYMTEVRRYWLPSGWADTVHWKMLVSTQGQRPFHEWAVDVQGQNTLLRGTTSHLADANILYHLEVHMNAELAADYHTEQISENNLCKWVEKVWLLDEKCLCYLTRQREALFSDACQMLITHESLPDVIRHSSAQSNANPLNPMFIH
ncbi:uncharacterized protein F5147DRAFT_778161 [Suillus discolor]|uniref:Uncharacterized protein n=1 Tax=Suillus discolor TaxID=1912936 RepID=A0A9P7EXP4_9AGAM|nr:uncharacterized protein F5147DRAFT_778161 [Suillus discolor]KAG2097023.1 hypothetical protein F5147DRAFT_778161 [Suillus discolor]